MEVHLKSLMGNTINQIAIREENFFLIFDDFHVVTKRQIQNAIEYLLNNLPSNCLVAIGSRTQSPFPLSKMRVQSRLKVIEAHDLRLDMAEAEHLFRVKNDIDIQEEELEQIYRQTDGWAGVMQLAAISFKKANRPEFLKKSEKKIIGSVSDFFAEEVLSSISKTHSDFLMRVSIAQRINESLCLAITGDVETSSDLKSLCNIHFLIQQIDQKGEWYQIHPLFRECLLQRLDRNFPEKKLRLHKNASVWFEEQGQIAEATDHAIRGNDKAHAVELLEERGVMLINTGHLSLLFDLIRRLPKKFLYSSLDLLIQLAWIEVLNYRVNSTKRLLREIDGILERSESVSTKQQSEARELEVGVHYFEDNLKKSSDIGEIWAEKAVKKSRQQISFKLVQIHYDLARGQYADVIQACRRALGSAELIDAFITFCYLHCDLTASYFHIANHKMAIASTERAMEKIANWVGDSSQAISLLNPLLATCYYHSGNTQHAKKLFWGRISENAAPGGPEMLLITSPAKIRVSLKTEGRDVAMDRLLKMQILAHERNLARLQSVLLYEQIRMLIEIGDFEQASAIFERDFREIERDKLHKNFVMDWQSFSKARIALAMGNVSVAKDLTYDLMSRSHFIVSPFREIEVRAFRARLLWEADNQEQAFHIILGALKLDAEKSIVQPYRDEGEALIQVLRALIKEIEEDSQSADFETLRHLKLIVSESRNWVYDHGGQRLSLAQNTPDRSVLKEITKREMQTLLCLAEGLSNVEIAERLGVSISTIKSHINSGYRKMGVSRRTQAVRQLKELGVLS